MCIIVFHGENINNFVRTWCLLKCISSFRCDTVNRLKDSVRFLLSFSCCFLDWLNCSFWHGQVGGHNVRLVRSSESLAEIYEISVRPSAQVIQKVVNS